MHAPIGRPLLRRHARRLVSAVTALAACADAEAAQICNDRINATASVNRLIAQSDGTVFDTVTNLTWMRCPLGYALDDDGTPDATADDRCVEQSAIRFNWQQALQAAEALNAGSGFAGLSDWRVPSIKELASIVERKCAVPAWDTTIFPAVETSVLWSSTTYNILAEAAVFDFTLGTATTTFKDVPGNDNFLRGVRLVR